MKINNDNISSTVSINDESVSSKFSFDTTENPGLKKATDHLNAVVQPQLEALKATDGWRIKRTPATFRHIQRMKLSDAEVTEMLKTHQGRSKFGYNYLEKSQHGFRLQQNMEGQVQY